MAEVLGGFAAVASIPQLADVVLRSTREICGFLSATKDASKDARYLRTVLGDIESIIRNLSRFIAEYNQSPNALEDFDVLPETVTRAVHDFSNDLATLKGMLPADLSPSLAQKFRWVYDRKKLKEATQRLNHRKTTLQLSLEIVGQWRNIKQHDATRKLHEATQITSQAAVHSHTSAIGAVSDTLNDVQNMVRSGQGLQAQSVPLLQELRTNLAAGQADLNGQLGALRASVEGISLSERSGSMAVDGISQPVADLLGRIIRFELQRVVLPVVEEGFTKSYAHNEAMIQEAKGSIELFSRECSRAMAFQEHRPSHQGPVFSSSHQQGSQASPAASRDEQNSHCHLNDGTHFNSRSWPGQEGFEGSPAATMDEQNLRNHLDDGADSSSSEHFAEEPTCVIRPSASRAPVRLSQKTRRLDLRIGYLVVNFFTFRRRDEFPSSAGVYFSISVKFYPSTRFVTLPGIAMSYTNAPGQQGCQQGCYQLCPSLTAFPIIPRDAPVISCLVTGDLDGLQNLFAKGLASPYDQDCEGSSLLSLAAMFNNVSACRFLLQAGADPTSRNVYRSTAFEAALFSGGSVAPFQGAQLLNMLWNTECAVSDMFSAYRTHLLLEDLYRDLGLPPWLELMKKCSAEVRHYFQEAFCFWYNTGWWSFAPNKEEQTRLRFAIATGLDPNTQFRNGPALACALISVQMVTGRSDGWTHPLRSFWKIVIGRPEAEWTDPLWSTVSLLIRAGADIYITFPPPEWTGSNHWYTPSLFANELGVLKEWDAALQDCGYDPTEVWNESLRRLEKCDVLHNADRSAVDVEDLLPPPRKGLSKRAGRAFEES